MELRTVLQEIDIDLCDEEMVSFFPHFAISDVYLFRALRIRAISAKWLLCEEELLGVRITSSLAHAFWQGRVFYEWQGSDTLEARL